MKQSSYFGSQLSVAEMCRQRHDQITELSLIVEMATMSAAYISENIVVKPVSGRTVLLLHQNCSCMPAANNNGYSNH